MAKNAWIASRARAAAPRLRLYCFPYAGRGASLYVRWESLLGPGVEVCPVQLPGREDRLDEPPARRMSGIVDRFLADVGPELDRPFAFFGYSMGGVVAFEIARRLQVAGARSPELLFVSASRPPGTHKQAKTYELPDAALVAELRRWNGTPEVVLREPELLRMVLPIVRADLELLYHYEPPANAALTCPIFALGGTRDPQLPVPLLSRWRDFTRERFDLQMFDGDHFFINANPGAIQALVGSELGKRFVDASLARAS